MRLCVCVSWDTEDGERWVRAEERGAQIEKQKKMFTAKQSGTKLLPHSPTPLALYIFYDKYTQAYTQLCCGE